MAPAESWMGWSNGRWEGETLVVGSLAYSTVVFASLLGVLVWDEVLGAGSWIAIAIIVASGVVATVAAPRQEFD